MLVSVLARVCPYQDYSPPPAYTVGTPDTCDAVAAAPGWIYPAYKSPLWEPKGPFPAVFGLFSGQYRVTTVYLRWSGVRAGTISNSRLRMCGGTAARAARRVLAMVTRYPG